VASPQLEDGHTKIANEILERLAQLYLAPNQWQIIIFILRKTYGYRKKVDHLANWQIANGTGLHKHVISRALKALNGRNIITREGKMVGFQKDWEQWQLPEQVTKVTQTGNRNNEKGYLNRQPELPEQVTELPEQVTKVTSPHVTQKKKETIQKKLYKRKYGEFSNVLLTEQEIKKLNDRFGKVRAEELIEQLSAGIKSKGYKYQDHYATILNWSRRDEKEFDNGKSGRHSKGHSAEELEASIGKPLG